jgi:hypothetical protein
MIAELLFSVSLLVSAPDISGAKAGDWQLHQSLGVIVRIEGDPVRWVAYPIRQTERVKGCEKVVDRDPFLLTFRVCGGTLRYTLGEPTLWRYEGGEWQWVDNWK